MEEGSTADFGEPTADEHHAVENIIWVLSSLALVMLLQPGFTRDEVGAIAGVLPVREILAKKIGAAAISFIAWVCAFVKSGILYPVLAQCVCADKDWAASTRSDSFFGCGE
eukprot:g20113.t1